MTKTKFSNILQFIKKITNSQSCYILMVDDSPHIVDFQGEIIPTEDVVMQFNNEVQMSWTNSNKDIQNWPSTQKLIKNYTLSNVEVCELSLIEDKHYYLILYKNGAQRNNTGSLQFEVMVDFLSQFVELESKLIDQKSEERYRLLIRSAADFVFSLNGFGYILEINENGANALGYSIDEMHGNHFLDFISENKRLEITDVFQKMLNSKTTTHFEIELLHKLKKPIIYEFVATPLLENNTIVGMMGIGRDISRRKKNEGIIKKLDDKLQKANRLVTLERDRAKKQITVLEELNLLKNEFISNVSHELRTPLASIVGFAETLSTDENLSQDNIKEFSNIIFAEGKRLARFIEDILDFSKLEDSKNLNKEKQSLIELINQVISEINPLIAEKEITLISEIPEAEISIFADKEKLSKAFLTIFENAIHYTESHGQITIFVQDFLKEVEIFVTDSGIGIPEKELRMFFEKIHSTGSSVTKAPIAGASLSLAKQIIEFHEGVLQVKSIIGEGTTMIVHLPKTIN